MLGARRLCAVIIRTRLSAKFSSVTMDGLPLIVNNANEVTSRITEAVTASGRSTSSVRLVAVSKTKSASDIKQLYDAGYRHFGENYFQELLEKVPLLPDDIQWHFIGHLQSSKASKLIREVPSLYVVETIDSNKIATKLNAACESVDKILNVFIQVDTSGEETKSGIAPGGELNELAKFIKAECPHLSLKGLMTIGAPGDMACFDKLVHAADDLATELNINRNDLELSMGMSGDYEEAIRRGATSVRVGSVIFGERLYPNRA